MILDLDEGDGCVFTNVKGSMILTFFLTLSFC